MSSSSLAVEPQLVRTISIGEKLLDVALDLPHINAEQVAQDGLTDVHRDSTHEDSHHRDPLQVLEERSKQSPTLSTEAHDGQCDVAHQREDDDDCDEEIETLEVELVETWLVPEESVVS